MIVDTFMFRGEFDLLDFRLYELNERMDHHVLVEAAYTHRGEERALTFPEKQHLYSEYDITPIYVKEFPPSNPAHTPREAAWAREHFQRDAATHFIDDFCTEDDIVLISDLDEFPSDEALAWDGHRAVALLQRTFHSSIGWEYLEPQYASVMARARLVSERGLAATRDGRYTYPIIFNGGFHFSWLGTAQDRQHKLELTCHLELEGEEEWEAIRSNATYERGEHHASGTVVKPVEIDESFPRWIREGKCPQSWFRPKG